MIRRYQPSDFDDVAYLNQICYLKPCAADELREKLQHSSWVADDDGVIGCIITCPDADKVLIWSVTVAPSRRNQGIGCKLMDAAEQFYAGREMKLYVEISNPAVHLYKKHGYRAAQIIKDFYGAGYDCLEMYKVC